MLAQSAPITAQTESDTYATMPTVVSAGDARGDFERDGYLALPGAIPAERNAVLRAELDDYVQVWRTTKQRPNALDYPAMRALAVWPEMLDRVRSLFGTTFSMHHLHADRHDPGCVGVHWHQDYEQLPQTNRVHPMVHIFYYLSGLDGTIGDLLVVPRSHRTVIERNALSLFGSNVLPGEKVFDNVSPGSAVIVHSALWHARRAKPGGSGGRYFIDVSYCGHGTRWPLNRDWFDRLNLANERRESDPEHAWLFDTSCYFDPALYRERMARCNIGSLATLLPEIR